MGKGSSYVSGTPVALQPKNTTVKMPTYQSFYASVQFKDTAYETRRITQWGSQSRSTRFPDQTENQPHAHTRTYSSCKLTDVRQLNALVPWHSLRTEIHGGLDVRYDFGRTFK